MIIFGYVCLLLLAVRVISRKNQVEMHCRELCFFLLSLQAKKAVLKGVHETRKKKIRTAVRFRLPKTFRPPRAPKYPRKSTPRRPRFVAKYFGGFTVHYSVMKERLVMNLSVCRSLPVSKHHRHKDRFYNYIWALFFSAKSVVHFAGHGK